MLIKPLPLDIRETCSTLIYFSNSSKLAFLKKKKLSLYFKTSNKDQFPTELNYLSNLITEEKGMKVHNKIQRKEKKKADVNGYVKADR